MGQMQQRFEQYHRDNPHVYDALLRFTRQIKAAGRSEYAIAAVFERVRWHFYIETNTDEGFKLPNNFKPYFSRLIMHNEKDLAGIFVLRRMKVEYVPGLSSEQGGLL